MSQDPTTGSVLIPANGDFVFDGGYAEDDPEFQGGAPVASPEAMAEAPVVRELTTVVPHNKPQVEQIPEMPYRTDAQLEAANEFHLNREADARQREILDALIGQAQFMSDGITHWRTQATKAERE